MARALSSSRRAPPNSAVKPCSSTASSSTGVWIRLREPLGSSLTVPAAIASGTEATISCTPSSATRLSRNSSTSGKFRPVSTCMTGNGMRAGANALRASSSITMESLPPENSSTGPLELGDDLADDVDGLGLQRLQLAEPVVGRRHGGRGSGGSTSGRPTASVRCGFPLQCPLSTQTAPQPGSVRRAPGGRRPGQAARDRGRCRPAGSRRAGRWSARPPGRRRPARRSPTGTCRRRGRRRRPRPRTTATVL